MDTWNTLTAVGWWRVRVWGELDEKKLKGLAKEHICITYKNRQKCGDGQRDGWCWDGWRQEKGVGNGDI